VVSPYGILRRRYSYSRRRRYSGHRSSKYSNAGCCPHAYPRPRTDWHAHILYAESAPGDWVQTGGPPGVVWSLAINPREPTILYAGTEGRGVFKSEDGGNSWIVKGLESTSVHTLVLDPAKPDTLYAGTNKGIFKSEDGGSSWMTMETDLSYGDITCLIINQRIQIFCIWGVQVAMTF